ncbi:hypothetical protein C8R46DRAFT_1186739 [Mycena filopes]|nr:hypothetical protein C8R46DRAFT_1186739 [Mycena filopes]
MSHPANATRTCACISRDVGEGGKVGHGDAHGLDGRSMVGVKGAPAFKPVTKGRFFLVGSTQGQRFLCLRRRNFPASHIACGCLAGTSDLIPLIFFFPPPRSDRRRTRWEKLPMSNSVPTPARPASPVPVLDDENCVICTICKERVHCGPSGINNWLKRHKNKAICLAAKAKRNPSQKPLKNGAISTWLRPKTAPVPSTVAAAPLIHPAISPHSQILIPAPSASAPPSTRTLDPPRSLLKQLQAAIEMLPVTIPEATESDALAVFGRDPSQDVDSEIPPLEVYEHLNPLFHAAFGWKMTLAETSQVLKRGRWGLDGLLCFMQYFVHQRGVREQDFAAKIHQILDAMKFLNPPSTAGAPQHCEIATPPPEADEIEFISHTPAPIISRRCEGFIFPLKKDQTLATAYPVQMHDKYPLPWDFGLRRGILYLTAHRCAGTRRSGHENCAACAALADHSVLQGIISRSANGIHENTNLVYQPTAALVDITRKKNVVIQNLRLGLLTNSRKLLTQSSSLSDYKRFVVAIGSGEVKRVDRVVNACIKQKRGIRGMLDTYLRAARGLYKPANSEEEDMLGLVVFKLGGVRVAEIAHRACGLPGITTLRNRMITPPLTASPGAPKVEEIQKNIDACFIGIGDVLAVKKVVHQVVMFDEFATEKRIRWDPRTNQFLGVCRQHAHEVGLEFNGESDLDELMAALEKKPNAEGKLDSLVHNAGEVTVAAVGIMSEDTRLYAARPILISSDCKRESGLEHARNVLTPVLRALESKKDVTRMRTICLASDGETRRGTTFMIKTWKHKLPPTSDIYELLHGLKFMNLMVGEDDLTGDKDKKHADKRLRNGFLRERGIRIIGIDLTPNIMRTHLQSVGHTADHLRSIFNPEDKQDVRLAFEMLKDIWSLPPCPPGTSPGFAAAREALRTLGKFLFHFVSPYICVDYSLSEQLEHLSAAAHLALALFHRDGKHFMASLLYTDIIIIIKNVFFCVAKTKVDDPLGKFWLILLGTDRLEQLFGILRTMVGNDANCDVLQVLDRLRGTIEVSTIMAKHPAWDRAPRRLRLPAMTRDCTELSDKIDHINPASVRGDMRVQEVTLGTLDGMNEINILAPHGKDSFADLDPDDNEDEDVEIIVAPGPPPHALSMELEEAAEEELHALDIATPLRTPNSISPSITVGGQQVRKARALSQRLKYGNKKASTDRNRRVAGIPRHAGSSVVDSGMTEFDSIFGGPCLLIFDVIATLVACEGRIFLCLGEVNGIFLNSESLDSIGLDVLPEQTVNVSFQFLKLIPVTTEDDPSQKHDWKSAGALTQTLKVPGRMVQPLDPTLSTARLASSHYLFESNALRILTASLFEQLTPQRRLVVPSVSSTKFYPYREGGGRACFVCEKDDNSRNIDVPSTCPSCPPNTPLDPNQAQQVLAHMAAHILFDPSIDEDTEPCGACLSPTPMCEFHLTTSGTLKVNQTRTKCKAGLTFRYSNAAESTDSAPSSNVPVACALCATGAPAIWRYNYLHHLRTVHPMAPEEKYAAIWKLDRGEMTKLKKVWQSISRGVPIPKRREANSTGLVLSEAHNSRLSMRGETVVHFSDVEGPRAVDPMDESDEGDAVRMPAAHATHSTVPEDREMVIDAPRPQNLDLDGTPQQFVMVPPTSGVDGDSTRAATPSTMDQLIVPESPPIVEMGRGKRKRKTVDVGNLSQCLCGNSVAKNEPGKIKCNRNDCETKWYHLLCVDMDSAVSGSHWTCEACASSASGSRPKRIRRG